MCDQLEVAAPVEVGVRLCKEEFRSGDHVRMWGCPGGSGGDRLLTDRGGVVLFSVIAGAMGAHRIAAATGRTVGAWPRLASSVAVIKTSRTRGMRNMITVLRVVSGAYEICIPLHHTESQIFEVTDTKNVR